MATDFADQLDTPSRNLQELDGHHHRSADELFHEGFMSAHTRFPSFKEMLDKSGCTVAQEGSSQLLPEDCARRHVVWRLAKKAMVGV